MTIVRQAEAIRVLISRGWSHAQIIAAVGCTPAAIRSAIAHPKAHRRPRVLPRCEHCGQPIKAEARKASAKTD